jgi:hypothetical protein
MTDRLAHSSPRSRFLVRFGFTVALSTDFLRISDKSVITAASIANAVAVYAICCGYSQTSGLWVQNRNAQFGAAASAIFAAALNDAKLAAANIAAITRKKIAIVPTATDSLAEMIQRGLLRDSPVFLECSFRPAWRMLIAGSHVRSGHNQLP